MALSILEKTIEDILSSDKTILSEILQCHSESLSLVARQKAVTSGIIDLLYLLDENLLLIELKAVPFYSDVISQTEGYCQSLQDLQNRNKLIKVPITKIILVTACSAQDVKLCLEHDIHLLVYKPEDVLFKYFEHFKQLSYYLTIQSGDYGVVRLGLLLQTLKLLSEGKSIEQISQVEQKSRNTIRNRFSVAMGLGLLIKHEGEFFLTEMGNHFVNEGDPNFLDRLSEKQMARLSDFVKGSPFYSQITYTILSLVETIFVLAKTSYPVRKGDAQDFFVKSVGKEHTWKTPKSRSTAMYIFSNYAIDLQFLSVIGNNFYITPKGIQAILLLQLNRSIKLIEAQK